MASAAAFRGTPPPSQPKGATAPLDIPAIVRELASVADYIRSIKGEIGALRAHELCRDRLPMAHQELGVVVNATASATHTIMAAAEEILGAQDSSPEDYRSKVETKLLEIFEACSFQDITGQRIAKVVETLEHIEQRVARFADVMQAKDIEGFLSSHERARAERKEKFLLNGPQLAGEGADQSDVDKIFA